MSQAQERRRAEAWESNNKEIHERHVADLQMMKKRLDSLDPGSDEHKALKADYDKQYQAAEAFFMKYHES